MISAYPIEQIQNLKHQQKAKAWLKNEVISTAECQRIIEHYPCDLYRPKPAFRILFFIAAMISLQGIVGLLGLAFMQAMESMLYVAFWILGGFALVVNEFIFMSDKKHFRSGLLQGVYYSASIYILGGFGILFDDVNVPFFIVSALWFCLIAIRYMDRFALILSILSCNIAVFMIFQDIEGNAKFLVPFVLFGMNIGLYFILVNLAKLQKAEIWRDLIHLAKYITLIVAYLSLNLYVVQTAAISLLRYYDPLPFKWLFIICTLAIPMFYTVLGVRKKSRMFFRVGLVLLAIGIVSIKIFYSTGHTEFTLTAAGLILFGLSIYLIKKLKYPIQGFTSEKVEGKGSALMTVLMAAHAFDKGEHTPQEDVMGGGEFGGGGAGAEF